MENVQVSITTEKRKSNEDIGICLGCKSYGYKHPEEKEDSIVFCKTCRLFISICLLDSYNE